MESATANRIPLFIAHIAKMGNRDSLQNCHTQRDNEREGDVVSVGIGNGILWALCNSLIFLSEQNVSLQLC